MNVTRAEAIGTIGASTAAMWATPLLAQSASTIRMGTIIADSFAQPFYAIDGGFLDKAGITGHVQIFGGSGAISAALAGGAIDIGLIDAVAVANGLIHGVPFTVIGGSGLFVANQPTGFLCVDKTSTLKGPKDLAGQPVGVASLNSQTTISIQTMLQQNQADPYSVKFVELPFAQAPAALNRGTVAAAYIGEPILLNALATTSKQFANCYAALGPQVLVSNLVTTADWLSKNHDLAKRFVAAMRDTATWANSHRDLSAPILSKYSKIDLDVIKQMRRANFATTLDPKMLQGTLDAAARFKVTSRPVTLDEIIAKL